MNWKDNHRCTAHCPSSCQREADWLASCGAHVAAYYFWMATLAA